MPEFIPPPGLAERFLARLSSRRSTARFLGGTENCVYDVYSGGRRLILRITTASHRTLDQIKVELRWLEQLRIAGIAVCTAIHSPDHVATLIDNTQCYYGVLFERGRGRTLDVAYWTATWFQRLGATLSAIHACSRKLPRDWLTQRPTWREDNAYDVDFLRQSGHTAIAERLLGVLAEVDQFSVERDTYGLIHGDLHPGNVIMTGRSLTLIDFDDCRGSWYLSDLSTALHSWVKKSAASQLERGYAGQVFKWLLAGYGRDNAIDDDTAEQIDNLMKLREIGLYTMKLKWAINRAEDCTSIPEMSNMRQRIEDGRAIVELDTIRQALASQNKGRRSD